MLRRLKSAELVVCFRYQLTGLTGQLNETTYEGPLPTGRVDATRGPESRRYEYIVYSIRGIAEPFGISKACKADMSEGK